MPETSFFERILRLVPSGDADPKTAGTVRFLFLAAVLILAAWLLYFALVTVSIPYPLEYRESASQVMTAIFLRGGNPFSLAYQPLGMNNYGFGYSLIVAPFAAAFGNTLAVHRAVTLFFLVCSFILVLKTSAQYDLDPVLSLACGIFIVIPLASRGALGAFPSALGTFLFLAATLIPFNRSFDAPGLFVSALLCLLAFYTKPYFLLAFGIVAGYVFIFVSKKKGIFYGLFFALISGVSFLLVRRFLDLYFIDTIVGNLANTTRSLDSLASQLVELAREFFPALLLAVPLVWSAVRGAPKRPAQATRPLFDIRSFDGPLFHQPVNYYAYFMACSALVFVFLLGLHVGTYMMYAYQILVPPFLLWLFQQLGSRPRLSLTGALLLFLNLAILSGMLLNPRLLSQRNSAEWARLYEYADRSTRVLNSSVIAPVILEKGLLPVDSGQTKYYYSIFDYGSNRLAGPDYRIVKLAGRRYKDGIIAAVKNSEYDRIILDDIHWTYPFIYDDLLQHYFLADEFTVEMPQAGQSWTMAIWEPLDR